MKSESPFKIDNRAIISTLDHNIKLTHIRRDGDSTRQIDVAIQTIFDGNVCKVEDHWEAGSHREANKNLFNRILKRIRSEHERDSERIRFCRNQLLIKLI
jgi:hypothetical protein